MPRKKRQKMVMINNDRKTEKFRVLDDLVTTGYLAKIFRKAEMTITHWRRNEGLPFVIIPGEQGSTGRSRSIRFDLKEVQSWAKKNGREMFPVD